VSGIDDNEFGASEKRPISAATTFSSATTLAYLGGRPPDSGHIGGPVNRRPRKAMPRDPYTRGAMPPPARVKHPNPRFRP